ncbi:DUF3325 family protein [Moraxella boevrei]|uniref:DUF3325 family protein n=1 Tax=Faucicola boevrei TaxID=346665 RepID=UPI0037354C24
MKLWIIQSLIFLLILIGVTAIMLTKPRHQKTLKPLLLRHFSPLNLANKPFNTLGIALLMVSFGLNFTAIAVGHALVVWFGLLTLAILLVAIVLCYLDN